MKRYALFVLAATLLACGQFITPEPSPVAAELTATPALAVTLLPTVTLRPTATPRPATPEPTPTPTMTPTPIIYTVQPGDTLLGIAIQFGVDAEAIQVANGIIDPRSLQIDQVLIIPEPKDNSGEPTATPTPFPLIVQGVNFVENPPGTLWCFGEVANPGGSTLSEMVIGVNLFDANGELLASQAAYTALDVVPIGQTVPFAVPFDDPPPSFAQYQVAAISAVPLLGETRYHLDLNPVEVSATQVGENTYRINGQLENTGTDSVEAIKLVVTAYDDTGKVMALRQVSLDVAILLGGARTPFQIELTIPNATVSRYGVQAQALRAE